MLRHIKSFIRNENGVVAIEFGLLALPFFVLLIGTIEVSLFFAAGNILEGGTADAARLVRTGQAQLSDDPEETFRVELCDKISSLIPCEDVQYEVIRVEENTFAGAEDYEPEYDANGNMVPGGFSTGNSNDVVMIRTFYRYEFMTPFLSKALGGESGSLPHMTTAVIKAEPYNFGED